MSGTYANIRQLRQIRPSIDINSATILANALVHSNLDYCNSLCYSLPNSSKIHWLQLVQNSLARVVSSSTLRHHHITPVLKRLHWLPVEQRIKCKIASITCKSFHYQQPSYLCELLSPVARSGRHLSSNINYLTFNVSIQYLVYDPSFLVLLKSGIFFLLHFGYLLIIRSVPNLNFLFPP